MSNLVIFKFNFLKKFILKYSSLKVFCWFQLYSKLIQLYIYMNIYAFFKFFSHLVYYRILGRVGCAIQQVLVSYLFEIQLHAHINPKYPLYPSPQPLLFANHTLVYFQNRQSHIWGWPKSYFRVFHKMLQNILSEHFGQSNIKSPEWNLSKVLKKYSNLLILKVFQHNLTHK